MTHSAPRPRASLATSIIWRFVVYATLPVVVVGGCALLVLIRQNMQEVRNVNLQRAWSIARQIDGCMREPQAVLQTIATLLSDTSFMPPEKVESLLVTECSSDSIFDAIQLLDSSGRALASGRRSGSPEIPDTDTTGVLTSGYGVSLSGKKTTGSSGSVRYSTTPDGSLLMYLPVGNSHQVVLGTCSAAYLRGRLDHDIVERGEIVVVVNKAGQTVYGSDSGRQAHQAVAAALYYNGGSRRSRDTTFSVQIGAREFVGAVVPVGSAGLLVFVARKALAAYAPTLDAFFFFILVLAAFGLLSAGGGWFVARWLSRIFTYLSHNTRRIAQGDYQAQMPAQRHQELELLADNIRSMVAAVREREEQYRELNQETRRHLRFQRTLLEAINIPVVYYNVQGDILGCNSMFESAMGVSRDLLLHYQEAHDAPEVLHRLMDQIKNGAVAGAQAFERSVLFGDGRMHTVIIHQAPYFLEEGGVDGYVCAILDITENRLVEDAFQRLIQNTVGAHGVDFFHRIVRLLCEWIGCDGALIGELSAPGECRALSMMFNGLRVDEYVFEMEFSPARKAVTDGFVSIEDEVCMLYPFDRELKRLAIRGYAAVPLTAHDGVTLGVLEVYSRSRLYMPPMARGSMEILAAMAASELLRMRAERERVKLESQLRQMEKMDAIGQLAGGIAHDINNQLGCILGYADIIQDTNMVPEISNFVGKISNSVSRAADLVKKLLAFSRHGNFVMKPVNVTALIYEVVGLLQHSIDKSIVLSMVAADGQLYVMGDPAQLQNALLNLGLNARDALPEGGTITYEVSAVELDEGNIEEYPGCTAGPHVRIRVHDNGVGIAPEIIDRIFEPFFTTKAEGKGTGLGLAAVYGTVSSHRGTINVISEPARGAMFTVVLPSHAAPVEVNGVVEVKNTAFQSGTILVIDDEIDIRETTALILRKCGCTVITAGDGLEGIQIYIKYSGRIDLVILDMVLPGIDGKGTFERLLEIDPSVRVVIVSGYSVDGRVQAVLDRGARSFLQKPFRAADLVKLVAEVLSERPV